MIGTLFLRWQKINLFDTVFPFSSFVPFVAFVAKNSPSLSLRPPRLCASALNSLSP